MVKKTKRAPPAPPPKRARKATAQPLLSESARYERFASEYLIDGNATRAAICAGYSPKTAHSQGSRLLRHVKVAELLAAKQAKLHDRYEITADRVKRELALLAFANMGDYIGYEDGRPHLDMSAVTRDQTAAIQSLDVTTETVTRDDNSVREITKARIRLGPKREALVDLGKITGLFKDGIDVTVPVRFIVERTERSKKQPQEQET